jgi:geranylgeranyl pyrophosphate synthase
MDIRERLTEESRYIDGVLSESLEHVSGSILHAAMSYALLSPGKRIRPALCLAVYEACAHERTKIKPVLVAVEMVHAYSIVQDDLPSMDNSDLRRGKPTTHVVHGEDMALLASDALLTMSFELLASAPLCADFGVERCVTAVRTLAQLAGEAGLVGGQAMDVFTSSDQHVELETIEYIHRNKTASLMEASVLLGGIFGGASEADMQRLHLFGQQFGIAYQIVDDIADAALPASETGKASNQDVKNSTATYVSALGLQGAREEALKHLAVARDAAVNLEITCELLAGLVDYAADRVQH